MDKRQEIEKLKEERNGIVDKAQAEKRELTEQETNRIAEIRRSIERMRAELEREDEGLERQQPGATQTPQANIVQVLREMRSGRFSDATLAVFSRGQEQMRKAGIIGQSGYSVPMDMLQQRAALTASGTNKATINTEVQPILAPLYGSSVLAQAGARFLTGLTGNLRFPAYSGTTSSWEDENGAAQNGEGAISHIELSPKRLTTIVDISTQMLIQDDAGVEAMIQKEIIQSIIAKLEATALGSADTNSGKQPKGLFHGTISDKGQASYARMVGMETSVSTQNALVGNLAYITSPKGAEILRTTPKGKAEVSYIADTANSVNGYPMLRSTGVATNLNSGEVGIVFGNFADFVVAQWGGMDIVRDEITKAGNGMVRFVINTYWDFSALRSASFSIASIKK